LGDLGAFISVFFLMGHLRFIYAFGGFRTNIGILFFALALMVLFHSRLREFDKRFLFIVLVFACIVSHYTTSIIFCALIFASFIGSKMIPYCIGFWQSRRYTGKSQLKTGPTDQANSGTVTPTANKQKGMTIMGVLLFFVALFFWNSQVSGTTFDDEVLFFSKAFQNLGEMFMLEARGVGIETSLGIGIETVTAWITFGLYWLTSVLVGIGLLITCIRYLWESSVISQEPQRDDEMAYRFEPLYLVFALACSAILVASLAVPYLTKGYNPDRLYLQMMVVLAPFLVVAIIAISKFIHVRQVTSIMLGIIILYSLCSSGFVAQLFGEAKNMALNNKGEQFNQYYVYDQENYAANWLGGINTIEDPNIAADMQGHPILTSQGSIVFISNLDYLYWEPTHWNPRDFLYLRYRNVVDGKILDTQFDEHEMRESHYSFAGKGCIYSNGGSGIWR
jgi:uncharacterized membrane protein